MITRHRIPAEIFVLIKVDAALSVMVSMCGPVDSANFGIVRPVERMAFPVDSFGSDVDDRSNCSKVEISYACIINKLKQIQIHVVRY